MTSPDLSELPDPADSALSSVPAAGNRRGIPMPAHLTFFYGPMDCGKSTLALQIDHNHRRQGRHGLRLTRYDRSGRAAITTRVGLHDEAIEVTDDLDVRSLVQQRWASGQPLDYLIVDEAGFLNPEHVEQLAALVDDFHVDVYCFGLASDFRSKLLPGAARLFELADEVKPVQVEVLCWCGQRGHLNARIVNGAIAREGATVLVGDTVRVGDAPAVASVRYQVLCRRHYRSGELGPDLARSPSAREEDNDLN